MSGVDKGSKPGPFTTTDDEKARPFVAPVDAPTAVTLSTSPCPPVQSPTSAFPVGVSESVEKLPHDDVSSSPSSDNASVRSHTDVHSEDAEKTAGLSHDEEALSLTRSPTRTSFFGPLPSRDPDGVIYPEGGLEAWLVVLGSWCGMTAGFGYMNTIGIYQAYLSTNQLRDYSESSIGWIFGVYIFLSFGCGLQIGPIFDAKGPRMLVIAGAVLIMLSVMLLGLCTQYWHFMLVFSILGGVGTSLIFTPAVSAIGHFFYLKRANATGIAATGGSIGGIIFPLMLQALFPRVGWAWATRIQGFVLLILLIAAIFLIRSRLPPRPGSNVLPDFRIFRQPAFSLVTAGTYFLEWGLFVPVSYLASYALSSGSVTAAFSFQLVAIFNAGSCLGRWAPGYLADKFGRFNVMIVTIVMCLVSTLALWLPATLLVDENHYAAQRTVVKGLTITYAIVMGFASGSNISLTPVCVSMLCDTDQYGRYYATCYTIVSFGTLTGVPIAGAIITASQGRYWGVAIFTGLCYLCALVCFGAVRVMKVGWGTMKKY